MNKLFLTKEAKEILKKQIGYRNDSLSTGTYTIQEIIHFENEELGNDDIKETCLKLYNEDSALKVVENFFNKDKVWGLWVALKENILEYYAEDGVTEITSYKIAKDAVIISDLGEEGILFATKEHPDNLFLDIKEVKKTKSIRVK